MRRYWCYLVDHLMNLYPRRLLSVLLALSCMGTLASCSIWDIGGNEDVPEVAFGMRPVYYVGDSAKVIYADVPRIQQNGTGIVLLGTLLFTVDQGLGIHVTDNANPARPKSIAFIHVPGVSTVTASANPARIYANNFGDLVTLDIEDLRNVRVLDRDEGLFEQPLDFPEGYIGFFECYDPALGLLVRWEEATVNSPECRINF